MSKHRNPLPTSRPTMVMKPIALAKASSLTPAQAVQQAIAAYSQNDAKTAENICRQILNVDPHCFDALHLLGAIHLRGNRNAESESCLSAAIRLQPANVEVLTKLALLCTQLDRHDESLAWLGQAIKADSKRAPTYFIRATVLEKLTQTEAALADYQSAINLNPNYAEAYFYKANNLCAQTRFEDAIESYERAIEISPGAADLYYCRGNALQSLKQPIAALASYEIALKIDPGNIYALNNRANLLFQQERYQEALECYGELISLQPEQVDAWYNRANLQYALSNYDAALANYQEVIRLKSDHYLAYNNIGNIYFQREQFSTALAAYDQALKIKSDYAVAHQNRGNVFQETGAYDEALDCYQRSIAFDPANAETHNNLGNLQMGMRRSACALKSYERAYELNPAYVDAHSNLLFCLNLAKGYSPAQVMQQAKRWDEAHTKLQHGQAFSHLRPEPIEGRKLRIGYVSPDFRQHPVASFIAPILEWHNKQQFEIFCYYNFPRHDSRTAELMSHVDRWCDCCGLSDRQLADRIRADAIDILIDLAGHSAKNRLLSFAYKPAPVQMTYLGYPGTTGLTTMDYRITDAVADTPECESCYTEKLLRLPHSLWCYRPDLSMPEVSALPALKNGYLTFGSFNNFSKIDQDSIALWSEMLLAIPSSRLLLATVPEGILRNEIIDEFRDRGIDPQRLNIHSKLPKEQFLQLLQTADISLDPVTVNGATTTCDSLWLGVPVISKKGSRFRERAGLSLLKAAGIPEFAANDNDACVRLAVSLANDLPKLAGIRANLRRALTNSPLLDEKAFTKDLETIYKNAWDSWVERNNVLPDS